METFNYDNRKYLELDAEDLKHSKAKVEWIYANYEKLNITIYKQSENAPYLLINGYEIARATNVHDQNNVNDLQADFNFNESDYIRVTYRSE